MSSTQPSIQSLPNEILFKIASELSNKKDVVAFCCTSNQFCGIALPQLYSSFHHTIELQELDQTISKWNKRKPLKGFAKHGWYTRALYFKVNDHLRRGPGCKREGQRCAFIEDLVPQLKRVASKYILHFKNLVSFSISGQVANNLDFLLPTIRLVLTKLPKLTSLEVLMHVHGPTSMDSPRSNRKLDPKEIVAKLKHLSIATGAMDLTESLTAAADLEVYDASFFAKYLDGATSSLECLVLHQSDFEPRSGQPVSLAAMISLLNGNGMGGPLGGVNTASVPRSISRWTVPALKDLSVPSTSIPLLRSVQSLSPQTLRQLQRFHFVWPFNHFDSRRPKDQASSDRENSFSGKVTNFLSNMSNLQKLYIGIDGGTAEFFDGYGRESSDHRTKWRVREMDWRICAPKLEEVILCSTLNPYPDVEVIWTATKPFSA